MSAMNSSEVESIFGSYQPFAHAPDRAIFPVPGYPDQYRDLGPTPAELEELSTFQEFVARHIRPNAIRDVQCMLLWAEWIRYYRRQKRAVPDLILEDEFRDLILARFGLTIAEDGFRGNVYPGIQYIP